MLRRAVPSLPRHQRGALLILLVIALGILAATVFVSMLSSSDIQNKRGKQTAAALAQAKAALIGWSANPPPTPTHIERPGELPCPDTDAPGTAGYGYEEGTCGPGAVGRLPWKTLGLPELRDGYGEVLWYALDGRFRRRWGTSSSTNQPINSDTRPTMQVYASDGTTLLTPAGSEAAAIIFSAGPVLGSQIRGTASQQTNAANYLDNASPPILPTAFNNATSNGPFIQGGVKDVARNTIINDKLLIITANDLMKIVEARVGKELASILNQYYVYTAGIYTAGVYPYPAKDDDPGCLDVGSNAYLTACTSNANVCRGRIPDTAQPVNWGTPAPALPSWFAYNLWGQVIYYSVGAQYLQTTPANCSPSLTNDGNSGIKALFFMPGTPLGNSVRNAPSQSSTLSDYLEDTMNRNGWTGSAPNADIYCTPKSASCSPTPALNSNDHLYVLP